MTLDLIGQLAWTGFATATYYSLFAMAFALVLKVNRVWDFAQAGTMVFAYFALYVAYIELEWSLVPGLLVGLVVTVAVALMLERFGFDVFRRRNSSILTFFIFTIVFSQFAIYLAELVFGTEPKTLTPTLISPVFMVGKIAVSHWDLKAIAVTGSLTLALYIFMRHTREGERLVAVADNPDLAEAYGISRQRAYAVSMTISAVLLLGGIYLFGTKAALFPSTPLNRLLVYAVIATILAGIGNVFAAGVAAVLLSLLQAFSILVIGSKWQALLAYVLIFVTIIFFPRGVALPERLSGLRRPAGPSSSDDDEGAAGEGVPAAEPRKR
ncbi:MAG: branched-chain amino acid ABC transporter permease [Alphaproteobacteria bacterium]|nr:branched-chain amino acid ABC transporter permease [Alphaproteobacteria bacterium]